MSPWLFVSFLAGWIVGPSIVKAVRATQESDVPTIIWYCLKDWYQIHRKPYHLPSTGALKAMAGTVICASMATLFSLLGRNQYEDLYPLVFVVVVTLSARYFGSIAGLLGALSAAAIFAWMLYPPASFAVDDPIARMTLTILVLSGTIYSLLILLRQHRAIQNVSPSRQHR